MRNTITLQSLSDLFAACALKVLPEDTLDDFRLFRIDDQVSFIVLVISEKAASIDHTLYNYFSEEYTHIHKLPTFLKQWVRTIRIRDAQKRTSLITNDSIYLTFNYTAVLENVYGIEPSRITHIHGSLRDYDIDPVIGHGNLVRIQKIHDQKQKAQNLFDEKWESICSVIEEYYRNTLKDVNKYSYTLHNLAGKNIDEIFVIGHSLAGVDMPYFKEIDSITENKLSWTVYYYNPDEQKKFTESLMSIGIDENRIHLIPSTEFYNTN
ncbi:MAG: hypothetical protein E7495_01635 [Ruminococcus flavefaciens]|nr:hypothetical protein [Ruminococcus flavefaciens]